MNDTSEQKAFRMGLLAGIYLNQQRVVLAHERREPLRIGEELFYLENGKERLERVLHEICR